MTGTTISRFAWKPLVEIPESVPSATFIEGEDAEAFLNEYNGRVQVDYDGNKRLRVLSLSDGIVKGSNVFAVALTDQILRNQGIRVVTMADLERGLQTGALNLRGTYEDTGLVLRDEAKPNSYLAQNLAQQIRARGLKVGDTPLMIPLRGLNVVNDSNSEYGLVFELTEESQIVEAPQLSGKNNQKKFTIMDENGLPVSDENGKRIIYTIDSGLSRLYLSRDLNANSNWNSLADSLEYGRVVLGRGEATSADLLRKMYNQQDSEFSGKVKRAQEILRDGYKKAIQSL